MKRFLLPLVCAALAFGVASCSDDDTPGDPAGTVMLNMLDEHNGRTLLDDSDIYINDAGNFVSGGDCSLFMLGEASGLGAVRIASLRNPVPEAAVSPGQGYAAVCSAAAIQFPSQCVALPLAGSGANLLKFYVVSSLPDGENGSKGAVVKFVTAQPQRHGLPEWGDTVLTIENYDHLGQEVVYTLPTEDFEFVLDGEGQIGCEKRGRKLVFALTDWPYPGQRFGLTLRIGESYTNVFVEFLS